MKPPRALRVLALVVVSGMVVAGCGLTTSSGTAGTSPATPTSATPANSTSTGAATLTPAVSGTARTTSGSAATPAVAGNPSGVGVDIISVADKVRPASVMVQNLTAVPPNMAQRIGAGEVPAGVGTGFIYDPAGYIVTNNHVVQGADGLRVVLPPPDNRQLDAKLIGTDPQTDLAVIQVQADNLPTVPLGNSSALKVGQWVVAVGNALGLQGGPTVTAGVVSALDRDVQEPGSDEGQGGPNVPGGGPRGPGSGGGRAQAPSAATAGPTLYGLIQTDAAINPGNSGGPLVDLQGQVVGINTLGAVSANTIGFAISIDTAKPIIDQLRQNGHVTRGYLGVAVTSVNSAIQASSKLQSANGVLVGDVQAGGPAATAGVQAGDVIVKIGDTTVKDQGDLQNALTLQYKPGETVPLTITRGGNEQTVQVKLADRPAQTQ
jgi:S1-C subfamily serine protease